MRKFCHLLHNPEDGRLKSSARNFIITFFVSLIVFGVAAYFVSSFVTSTLTESFEDKDAVSLDIITVESNTEQNGEDASDVFDSIKGESFDFVIIGTDYQPDILNDYDIESKYTDGFPKRRNREYKADAVAVVRFDKEGKKLLISTIPTTMRLEVGGIITTLGDVYRENGLEYFLDKLTALTGFELDKYFVIDINDFPALINTIGGVNFNVPENMSYEDKEQKLKIDLKKGNQYINGDKAAQLLRFNDYVNPDNSRAKTTAEFMLTVADKLSEASFIEKATSYFTSFKKYFTTNYTADDLLENLDMISHYADFEKVITVYPGKYLTVGGAQRFEPDIKAAVSDYASYR